MPLVHLLVMMEKFLSARIVPGVTPATERTPPVLETSVVAIQQAPRTQLSDARVS